MQLTQKCGFLDTLVSRSGSSVMVDRGFTIRDTLHNLGVHLNIPPFLENRWQLPVTEVKAGRHIASVRIHVERAIKHTKNYGILKGTLPLSLEKLANQILSVCAWLTNFQTVLVLTTKSSSEEEVDDYLHDSCGKHERYGWQCRGQ